MQDCMDWRMLKLRTHRNNYTGRCNCPQWDQNKCDCTSGYISARLTQVLTDQCRDRTQLSIETDIALCEIANSNPTVRRTNKKGPFESKVAVVVFKAGQHFEVLTISFYVTVQGCPQKAAQLHTFYFTVSAFVVNKAKQQWSLWRHFNGMKYETDESHNTVDDHSLKIHSCTKIKLQHDFKIIYEK